MSERKQVPGSAGDKARAERLAEALRANLRRRKAQARAHATQPEIATTDEPAPKPPESGKDSA
jgi:ABC-type transporter Mla maintaining outer membrane lipid asymmetry ATPase subunit MlaF